MPDNDDVEIIGSFNPAPPVRKKRPSKFVRGAGIVLLILAFFAGFEFFHKKAQVASVSSVPSAPPLPDRRAGVSSNPEYRRKLALLNQERIQKAEQSGQSAIPSVGAETRGGRTPEVKPPAPLPPSRPADVDLLRRRQEARSQKAWESARTAEQEAIEKETVGILSTWSGAGDGLSVLSVRNPGTPAPGQPQRRRHGSGPGGKSARKNIPIIPAGKILYGRIINELNSDHPGPVLAQAVGGKFDGVKFLGSFQRDHGALVIKFDRVIYPDGETDSIGAYAVSPGAKLRSGLSTDVNHHYLYRYGALLGAAFLEGFGQAAMYANSTSYPSSFGTPIIGFNGMTLLQQSEMGIGQAGMMLSGNAMNAFNRPTTVKVAANTPVGLMIVAETGQKLPKEPSSGGNAPAKPGLVNAPVPSMVPQPGYPAMPMTGGYPGYGGGYGMPMMPMMP